MRGYLEDLKAGGRPMTDKELLEHYKHLLEHYKYLYNKLKKQKADVVEYIKNRIVEDDYILRTDTKMIKNELLRMLGEIDE